MAKAQTDLEKLARVHAGAALETLVEIMTCDDAAPTARITAARSVLERAFDKPVPQNDDKRPLRELSMAELAARADQMLESATRQFELQRQRNAEFVRKKREKAALRARLSDQNRCGHTKGRDAREQQRA